MRLLNQNYIEIKQSEADLTKGYIANEVIIKPDAIPVDNITKYAWDDEDYEEVEVYYTLPQEILNEQKIAELKQKLAETDYITLKLVEGAITQEEASDVLAMRAQWRLEINELGG